MKRLILSILLLSGLHAQLNAQHKEATAPKLSPLTQQYLVKAAQATTTPLPGYVYRQDASGKIFISALIQADANINQEDLIQIGAIVGTKAGNVWTVQVPLNKVTDFTKIQGASYIQLDEPVFPTMDSVRKITRVDSVHAGINLPMAFTGKNVVMGIMDVGFDYTHPLFYDTTGNRYRIRKIWEEKTATGTPPAGFTFGSEITDSTAMRTKGTDINSQSHGTHVAGICAGSGVSSSADNSRFRGVGFGTDLVLVGITPAQSQWMNTGMTDLIDGMNYIYAYATSVGKPAVINLSWGCSVGSHDGMSLFSKAVDNLTGAGRLFVCSAGNTGTDNIHLQKTFTATDTTLTTVVTFDATPNDKKTWIDVWGDSSKTFCAKVTLYNNNIAGNTTGFICLDNTIHSQYLIGALGDTCFVDITTSTSEFNGKPRIFINLRNKAADQVNLAFKSTDAKLNVFEGYVENSTGYYGSLSGGNTTMTISDFSATKSAISVGAFATRNTFVNVDGGTQSYTTYVGRGRLVPFSSHGPTMDGRVSPDIAAPGFLVASGVNSFDASFQTGGSNYANVFNTFTLNSRNYHYAMLSGTSMSSPVVSGIVSLMLEADPTLTPQRTKDILATTAILDTYTGALTPAGNNNWGHGKVNAYGAIKKIIHDLSVNQVISSTLKWSVYPNPNNGLFSIACISTKNEAASLEVYDMLGKLMMQKNWQINAGNNTTMLDASTLAKGIYFTKITVGNRSNTVKTVIE